MQPTDFMLAGSTGKTFFAAVAVQILPGAWQAALKEVRVGLRPATSNGVPLIGPAANSPRVILATGHFRNGVMLAPLTAQMVTRAVNSR